MTNEEIASEIDRLTKLLVAGAGGWADQTTSKDFEATLFRLEGALPDPYGNTKIRSACQWVPILFSARKHLAQGTASVRQFLLQDLSNARRSLR